MSEPTATRVARLSYFFPAHNEAANLEGLVEEALATLRLTILNMDPPKHNRYRRLVSRGFTPRVVTQMLLWK